MSVAAPTASTLVVAGRGSRIRSRSQFQLAARRFRREPVAVGGRATLVVMLVLPFAVPPSFPYDHEAQTDALPARPGTDGHLFGTDTLGRDVLLLTLRGIQWSTLMVVVRPAAPGPGGQAGVSHQPGRSPS